MVVGPGARREHPRIVGAVEVSTEDETEKALNRKIVELTLLLAELEGGTPTLLHAWEPFAEAMVRAHSSDAAFEAFVNEIRLRSESDLARLVAPFSDRLLRPQVTIRRGKPEDVIPEFVDAHGVDLVVMGTVARTGIAGLLFGNTAERLLRRLPCSVLAVKPDGFVSPVRLDGA
jgi:nucleotide-binding universal stress UspA family protein